MSAPIPCEKCTLLFNTMVCDEVGCGNYRPPFNPDPMTTPSANTPNRKYSEWLAKWEWGMPFCVGCGIPAGSSPMKAYALLAELLDTCEVGPDCGHSYRLCIEWRCRRKVGHSGPHVGCSGGRPCSIWEGE